MNKKTKICLFLTMIIASILISDCNNIRCGDGICQKWEKKRGSCLDDCLNKIPDIKITEILSEGAGAVDWSAENNYIAYDTKTTGKADIWIMKPDGTERKCLTCGDFPGRHAGVPAWSSDGNYILFSAEKESHGFLDGKVPSPALEPGWGINHDLWVMKVDLNKESPVIGKWKIVEVDIGEGILHPHFSKDGEKIVWSEIMTFNDNDPYTWEQAMIAYENGNLSKVTMKWGLQDWRLRIANFSKDQGVPQLDNIETLPRLPDIKIFHEAHGFSPDGSKIIFSSNDKRDDYHWFGFDIYTYDLNTKKLEQLTDSSEIWDEHAHYSSNGRIIWTPNTGFEIGSYRREYWIMDEDGSNKTVSQRVIPVNPVFKELVPPCQPKWCTCSAHA